MRGVVLRPRALFVLSGFCAGGWPEAGGNALPHHCLCRSLACAQWGAKDWGQQSRVADGSSADSRRANGWPPIDSPVEQHNGNTWKVNGWRAERVGTVDQRPKGPRTEG